MALANRKRKFANISDSSTTTTISALPQTVFTSQAQIQCRQKITSQNPRRGSKKRKVAQLTKEHPASTFKTPNNPKATLGGLPAEIRLQIYNHLCDSTLIHVHRHIDSKSGTSRFTWTPCRLANPNSPLLCANPKWSGLCNEEDRCTYKIYAPPEPRGFCALAASNKFIRNEAQELFLRMTVISIHPEDLRPWLDHLAKHTPKQLGHLRCITLAGPNDYYFDSQAAFQVLRDYVPNLEGVGFQCQDWAWRWFGSYADTAVVNAEAWKSWNIVDRMRGCDSTTTIAMEVIAWRKPHLRWNPDDMGEQVAIRIQRDGKSPVDGASGHADSAWSDDDVEVEIVRPGKLTAWKRNAKWRQWWRGKETEGMTWTPAMVC